jgi:hypothetical protein
MSKFLLLGLFILSAQGEMPGQAQPPSASNNQPLQFLISVEQQAITAPFSARPTLHIHNGGRVPVWLYRHARSKAVISRIEAAQSVPVSDDAPASPGNQSKGGSTLDFELVPESQQQVQTAARAEVLQSTGMPHPTLVKVAPGGDYEEKAIVHLSPAFLGTGEAQPDWGRYRFSATYGAAYSNADEINRVLGVSVWQGEITSNTVELQLLPPPASARGTVEGSVVAADGHLMTGMLVTLSDEQQHAIDQFLSDPRGQFSFEHLPAGVYWTTARYDTASVDTNAFLHVEVGGGQSTAEARLVILPTEIYEPKHMLHKPVLFRVMNSSGEPASGVGLEVTWSSGTVLDNVRGQTSEDGTVAVALIPGRNFVTLKRHHCPKQDERVDVAQGNGIDGFKLSLECR